MENKTKVLYFVDRMLCGGIQTFVYENIKHMDLSKLQIDFLLLDDGNHYDMEKYLKKLGCNIYILKGMWIRKPFDYFKYAKMLDNFFKQHNDYKCIHLHSSSKNFIVLKYAKKYGVKIRIAHSHNIGFQTKNKINILVGNILKKALKKYATDYFACSKIAGQWLFGKNIINHKNFYIVHNAVDLEKYKYDLDIRNKIRNKYQIHNDTIVLGHVGRFTEQKNHEFLIDVFKEYKKINPNSKLMLVGTGIKESEVKEKVKKLNLEKEVIFVGFKDNVNEYMFAMDCFVFPSKFEGLGLVLIEAQATGMKCLTSKNVVPQEAKVSELLRYILLENSKEWAEIIAKLNFDRQDVSSEIRSSGYDINDTADFLEKFYLK